MHKIFNSNIQEFSLYSFTFTMYSSNGSLLIKLKLNHILQYKEEKYIDAPPPKKLELFMKCYGADRILPI